MPIRFSTQAANADHMGTDFDAPAGLTDTRVADDTPRQRGDRASPREPEPDVQGGPDKTNAGKAGKDINAPGFIKEKDSDNV